MRIFKSLSIIVASAILAIAFGGTSFADWSDAGADLSVNGDTVKLSNNVKGAYATPTDHGSYSAATFNTKGTKAYGLGSWTGNVKYIDCGGTCGDSPSGVTAPSAGDSSDFSGWSDL